MAKTSIYDYSTAAASNTDIGGIGILGSNAVLNFDNAFREIMAQIATDISPRRLSIQGAIYGLTLSNNVGDAVNDIDIAVGMATTDSVTDPRTMVLATAITKRLDAAWSVGTNQGGWLDGASMPNGTGHAFMMQRSDTGVTDIGFSASTSPTLPANYDRKRRIGSIPREGGALITIKQDGPLFRRATKVDRSSTSAAASALLALSVPTGINVYPLLNYDIATGTASTDAQLLIGGAWEGSATNTIDRVFTTSLANTASVTHGGIGPIFQTNTSAQIYFATTIASGSLSTNVLSTVGWIDNRGTV
ncbi:hypothetical protein [Rhizobium leguminosarum]|uniref:hypothetical protein n=1 Tax=Rhizobium leguminosarum TaxID=384 RepID=UPI00144116EA|nr:hypothetical protein [Rhizobium leguminosarum]NKK41683.1 hypothetical protein [Rhizobium leguminosarum bv. viciae]